MQDVWASSVPPLQLFCKCKTVLSNEVFFKNKNNDCIEQFLRNIKEGKKICMHVCDSVYVYIPTFPPRNHGMRNQALVKMVTNSKKTEWERVW